MIPVTLINPMNPSRDSSPSYDSYESYEYLVRQIYSDARAALALLVDGFKLKPERDVSVARLPPTAFQPGGLATWRAELRSAC